MQLKDKVAIITGAGSGFGKATSELFAEEGAKVVVVDYNLESAEKTVKEIQDAGGEAIAVQGDVSQVEDVQNFIQKAIDTYGQIDVLFNNAGIYAPGNAEEVSLEDFNKSIEVNVNGVFYASKFAIPYLKKTKGCIISTASAGGIIGFPGAVAYGTTKGAVISMMKAIAVDYAIDGVRANAICPGTGVTGMTSALLEDDAIREGFLAPIPMKRLGQPDDIAKAALFLASDQASYITGHALPVDGGWTMS
ncbi:short-chain dehydrogenase [Suicoccus acidiformans]|uniref:Short-chain dehydrogenase n=1 Tax=Suicoccus acidiformans TaxID=2036206 RepID=A0A347WMA1_9LACT|nr:SDR family NAD(P)-dependent oxidoreductase [Suicoccus acidiformans]AXY26208.1 short-chain dehydrogenase [Suicoccus acidiformans]